MFAFRFKVFLARWFWMGFARFRLPARFTVGAYPTYPSVGPLEGKSPREQAWWLRVRGITLAGGLEGDFRAGTRERPDRLDRLSLQEPVGIWKGGVRFWSDLRADKVGTDGGFMG